MCEHPTLCMSARMTYIVDGLLYSNSRSSAMMVCTCEDLSYGAWFLDDRTYEQVFPSSGFFILTKKMIQGQYWLESFR